MTRFSIKGRTAAERLGVWTATAAVAAAIFAWDALPAYAFLARPALLAAIGNATKAPSGWLQLCAANADECKPMADQARDVTRTPDLLQQLYEINKYVNDRVTWTSDSELYGKTERWAYPLDRGDCEDMVLLKRRLLAKAGWPQGALLITIVEEHGQTRTRHAVLTVRSDRGEMILDNQTPEILFWYETNYHYLSRQSATDPNIWVAFGVEQARSTIEVASAPAPLAASFALPPPLGIKP